MPSQPSKVSRMEFQFNPFPLSPLNLFLLLSFLFLLVKTWTKIQTSKKAQNLPPGPPKLPLIGNIHYLIGGLPHHVFRDLAKIYGPLMHLQIGEVSTVVVSSAKIAKDVLVTHHPSFANRPNNLATKIIWYDQQDVSFSPYGDYWKQMRKICMLELLSIKNVASFGSIRQDEISKLVESIQSTPGVPINLSEKIFAYTNSVICRAAFGQVCKDKENMIKNVRIAFALHAGFNLGDLFPSLKFLPTISWLKKKLMKVHREMDEILDDVVKNHKANHESGKKGNAESGDEDLIDTLLQQQETGNLQIPITVQNIKAVILDMFTAGTDTSSIATEWAMAELARHPSIMAKAQAEVRQVCKGKKTIEDADVQKLKFFKMVIQETLRLHPPVPFIPRASRENREVNGYMVPDKAQVLVNVWAIGRDPEYWDDPEKFIPERFEQRSVDYVGTKFEYIPFGAGRRMCPGTTFALASFELSLANLLYRFDWKLPNGMKPCDLDMEETAGTTAGRKNSLYLIAVASNT